MKLTSILFATAFVISCALAHDHDHEHKHDHDNDHAHEHDHDHEHHERGVEIYGRVMSDPRALRRKSLPLAGFVAWRIGAPCEIHPGDEVLRLVSPDAATAYGELATLETRLDAVNKSGAKNASLAAELAAKRIAYAAMTNALVAVDAGRGEFSLRATVRGRVNEQLVASGVFAERGTDNGHPEDDGGEAAGRVRARPVLGRARACRRREGAHGGAYGHDAR